MTTVSSVVISSPGRAPGDRELDHRPAGHERVALLDRGDDRLRIDRRPLIARRLLADDRHRSRVAGPLVLNAVRIAAPGRSVVKAHVEERVPVVQIDVDLLGRARLVAVIDLEGVEVGSHPVGGRALRVEVEDVEVADALPETRVVHLEDRVRRALVREVEDRD